MSLDTPVCPSCQGPLSLTHQGDFDSWVCVAGHGLAVTTSELYHHIQDDENALLWSLARAATVAAGARACPMCERPMVSVDVAIDADEVPEGTPGDGDDTGDAVVDVCLSDELVWFDQVGGTGELAAFPADLPNPIPTEADLAAVAQIRAAFGQSIVDAAHEREGHHQTERIYRRLAGRPRLVHALTEIGSLGRADGVGV